jgi:hypothetical protein
MALTRAEFLRLLPVAVGGAPHRVEGNVVSSEASRPAWRIRMGERPPRAFGPVRIPVLAVALEVDAGDEERDAFVARFLLGYQRAGG